MSNTNLDKRRIDVTKVFLIYLSTVGDAERTALACEMRELLKDARRMKRDKDRASYWARLEGK